MRVAMLEFGDRIGKTGRLAPTANAVIYDESRSKILLARRGDNGRWALIGGHCEPGETVAETCERELLEETGLVARATRLIGVYSSPHQVLSYGDGNRMQLIAFSFECEVTGGELTTTDEATEFGWFSSEEVAGLDLMEHHVERIADAFAPPDEAGETFVR